LTCGVGPARGRAAPGGSTFTPAGWLDSVEGEEEVTVIARIWRGWTTSENADAYQRIVSEEVLPGIARRNLDGYHGAYLLRPRTL
jgi:hypothetical protein